MDLIAGFRTRLREALERRGISQTELARQLKVRVATVNEWLNRDTMPSGQTMLRLPAVLAVDGHWLLTGERRPPAGEEALSADRRARAAALLEEAMRVLNAQDGAAAGPISPPGRLRKPRADDRRRRRRAPGERSHPRKSG
jgi:transcriptional regulator with XRE-family HTH domain